MNERVSSLNRCRPVRSWCVCHCDSAAGGRYNIYKSSQVNLGDEPKNLPNEPGLVEAFPCRLCSSVITGVGREEKKESQVEC